MKLNAVEKLLMNNPVRAALQRHYEGPLLEQLGGHVPGARVLEIGCGRGIGTQIILERFGAASVHASDYDLGMAAKARARLAPRASRATVCVADAGQLPYPTSAFDAVFDSVSFITFRIGAPRCARSHACCGRVDSSSSRRSHGRR